MNVAGTISLGEVASFVNGKTFKASEWTRSGWPIIRIQNLNNLKAEFNYYEGPLDRMVVVNPGDLLFSWSGSKGTSFGPHVWSGPKGVLNQHIFRVDLTLPELDKNYFYYCLKGLVSAVEAKAHGGVGLVHIKKSDLLKFRIKLLESSEQKRIAAILDKAEELKRKRQKTIELSQTFLRSVFLDMFGDPFGNPHKWPTADLASCVKEGTIVTYGIVQAGDEFPGGVPYIRTGDIVNGDIDCSRLRNTAPSIAAKFKRSEVCTGDIVMSIRATVGTTAVVPQEISGANLTQGTAKISPSDKTKMEYLLYYLRSDAIQHWIQRQVKGATFREITLGRLRELPVLLPPVELQDEFATIAKRYLRLNEQHRKSAIELECLNGALQNLLLSGEHQEFESGQGRDKIMNAL